MDIEEMMIYYILYEAEDHERDKFFGYADYELTRECCKDNLAQMPDEEFDRFVELFGFPTDGVKL